MIAKTHFDLEVRKRAFNCAMNIFELSKGFPSEEKFALTDQIRRSSRAVTANIAEAWHRRRYEAAFIQRLTDALAEAAETQEWLEYVAACAYVGYEHVHDLNAEYNDIIGTLNAMIKFSSKWCSSQVGFKATTASNHKQQSTNHS